MFAEIPTSAAEETSTAVSCLRLDDLPYYCKLVILSQLDTQDICRLSMASRHWNELCGGKILWRELLHRDVKKWSNISYKCYPFLSDAETCRLRQPHDGCKTGGQQENETNSSPSICLLDLHERLCRRADINYKALYFHSTYQHYQDKLLTGMRTEDPDVPDETLQQSNMTAASQSFPRFLRSIWMRIRSGNGEVIMIGPGMESKNTSKLFRRLMWARPDLLMTVRLLPGSQDGVGSGVELEFRGEKRFNLIALYSGNRRDRKKRKGLERLLESNILEHDSSTSADADGDSVESQQRKVSNLSISNGCYCSADCFVSEYSFKLSASVSNFLSRRNQACRLIYVVDATGGQSSTDLAYNRLELTALLEGVRNREDEVFRQSHPAEPHSGGADDHDDVQPVQNPSVSSSGFSSLIHFNHHPNAPNRMPLLILSCTEHVGVSRVSCAEICAYLDLASICDRPWLVQNVTVDNLDGLEDGLVWLFKQL